MRQFHYWDSEAAIVHSTLHCNSPIAHRTLHCTTSWTLSACALGKVCSGDRGKLSVILGRGTLLGPKLLSRELKWFAYYDPHHHLGTMLTWIVSTVLNEHLVTTFLMQLWGCSFKIIKNISEALYAIITNDNCTFTHQKYRLPSGRCIHIVFCDFDARKCGPRNAT